MGELDQGVAELGRVGEGESVGDPLGIKLAESTERGTGSDRIEDAVAHLARRPCGQSAVQDAGNHPDRLLTPLLRRPDDDVPLVEERQYHRHLELAPLVSRQPELETADPGPGLLGGEMSDSLHRSLEIGPCCPCALGRYRGEMLLEPIARLRALYVDCPLGRCEDTLGLAGHTGKPQLVLGERPLHGLELLRT